MTEIGMSEDEECEMIGVSSHRGCVQGRMWLESPSLQDHDLRPVWPLC